jgi:hypothetical protein
MPEKINLKTYWLLVKAASEIKIPMEHLKINKKGEIVLKDQPWIYLGDPRHPLREDQKKYIKGHLIPSIKNNIGFVVNQNTPFVDKKSRAFSVQNNMRTAFFEMMELKLFYPHIEIYMPEGINGIKPGEFWSYDKPLSSGLNFSVQKYVPPLQKDLADQVGLTFKLQHPEGKSHTHTVLVKCR